MALTYLSPGVYVEEVDKGPKPIEGAGTSLAAFIGITAEAGRNKVYDGDGNLIREDSVVGQPVLITSWTQYVNVFGGFHSDAYLPDAVYGYFQNGGGTCYVTSLRAMSQEDSSASTASVDVKASRGKSFTLEAVQAGTGANNLVVKVTVQKAEKGSDSFTLQVGDESKAGLTMKKDDENFVGNAEFEKVAITSVGTSMPVEGEYSLTGGGIRPLSAPEIIGDVDARTGLGALEAIDDIRLVACPDMMVGYQDDEASRERIRSVQKAMIDHCEKMRYRFAVLDTPPNLSVQDVMSWHSYVNFDSSYAAMYYPWIKVADLESGGTKTVPPSGYMIGVYNRVDGERGVHKAPANEIVRGAVDIEFHMTREEQDNLNPKGINCIRTFPGRGIRVWGARTLSSNGAWRYISVRRLFIFVEASMDAGLQWVVFEPNDSTLWAKVRRDVTSFLRNVWRTGALFGATDAQAFYVKCDEELNPPEVRDLGQLIIEVGMAPVKPAEFVIFRISQWAGADAEG